MDRNDVVVELLSNPAYDPHRLFTVRIGSVTVVSHYIYEQEHIEAVEDWISMLNEETISVGDGSAPAEAWYGDAGTGSSVPDGGAEADIWRNEEE